MAAAACSVSEQRQGASCHYWRASPGSSSLQAKQSESLRTQDSAIQKPDQNRNNMSHSLYNRPYALNHIQLVKWTFDKYEVNIFKMLAMIYHRFHVENRSVGN